MFCPAPAAELAGPQGRGGAGAGLPALRRHRHHHHERVPQVQVRGPRLPRVLRPHTPGIVKGRKERDMLACLENLSYFSEVVGILLFYLDGSLETILKLQNCPKWALNFTRTQFQMYHHCEEKKSFLGEVQKVLSNVQLLATL